MRNAKRREGNNLEGALKIIVKGELRAKNRVILSYATLFEILFPREEKENISRRNRGKVIQHDLHEEFLKTVHLPKNSFLNVVCIEIDKYAQL